MQTKSKPQGYFKILGNIISQRKAKSETADDRIGGAVMALACAVIFGVAGAIAAPALLATSIAEVIFMGGLGAVAGGAAGMAIPSITKKVFSIKAWGYLNPKNYTRAMSVRRQSHESVSQEKLLPHNKPKVSSKISSPKGVLNSMAKKPVMNKAKAVQKMVSPKAKK